MSNGESERALDEHRAIGSAQTAEFACAVPDDPDTIAPACPIVLPSGAVKPAT